MRPLHVACVRCAVLAVVGELLFVIAVVTADQTSPATEAKPTVPPPMRLTAQQDRQLMLDQLKILASAMRPGPSGWNPKAPNYQNVDEAKANPWPNLPEMLVTKRRQIVNTPDMWWTVRRPEIVEYFDAEVYGRVPKHVPKVTWEKAPPNANGGGFFGRGRFGRGGRSFQLSIPSITKQLVGRGELDPVSD